MDKHAERDAQVLAFVQNYYAAHGYVPTLREICIASGHQSKILAKDSLIRLAQQGHVSAPAAGIPRGYRLMTEQAATPHTVLLKAAMDAIELLRERRAPHALAVLQKAIMYTGEQK